MHVFGHDQKHLHRAETLPKFKHDDFAYALLLTDRQIHVQPRYAPKIQTMTSIITIQLQMQWLDLVYLVRSAHNELKRFQNSGTMV